MLFVGIPLPGTGAWTGALIAALLNMDIKITEGREVFEKTILNAIQKETNE